MAGGFVFTFPSVPMMGNRRGLLNFMLDRLALTE
jgi:hypothetical protein